MSKKLISCVLSIFSIQCYALSERETLIKEVSQFHLWANSVFGQQYRKNITPENLKKQLDQIFTQNVSHDLNGKTVAQGVDKIYQRFLTLNDKYKSVDVILPYDNMVVDVAQSKVSLQYRVKFILNDHSEKLIYASTIFQIKNHKIDIFNEISSTGQDHL